MDLGTVTLEKVYFETLLRRAQFHTSGVDFTTPVDVLTVTIPKTDHDSLLITSREYANLRRNLYRGGIAEDTLAVLIKDDPAVENGEPTVTSTAGDFSDSAIFQTQQSVSEMQENGAQDYTYGRNANYTPRNTELRQRDTNGFHNTVLNDEYSYMPEASFYDEGSGKNDSQTQFQRQRYDKFAKRTVQLGNLPDSTTHADIVDAVRGGMLLDIYLKAHDRTVNVSFLEEIHAQEFFRHVKRHDLYIRGKRVDIRWNDRQFILPGHVAHKIAIGATRNLVIQNRSPRHTEEMIRDDLEHIHNLVVIKVAFGSQNVYISTNSVHNAMFARTCMMSRSTYKGSKIEWDSDECASPFPQRPQQFRQENVTLKKDAPLMNRFQLLNMDGNGENSSSEDDDNETTGISFSTTMAPTAGILA